MLRRQDHHHQACILTLLTSYNQHWQMLAISFFFSLYLWLVQSLYLTPSILTTSHHYYLPEVNSQYSNHNLHQGSLSKHEVYNLLLPCFWADIIKRQTVNSPLSCLTYVPVSIITCHSLLLFTLESILAFNITLKLLTFAILSDKSERKEILQTPGIVDRI